MRLTLISIPFALACGTARSGELGINGGSKEGQVEPAPLEVTKNDDVVLIPLEDEAENAEFLTASLTWDQDGGRCRIQPGLLGEDAVAHFVRLEGVLDVYAVVPWNLSFPKGIDPAETLKPVKEHKFYLKDDGVTLTVKFSYSDTVIALHGVSREQEVERE